MKLHDSSGNKLDAYTWIKRMFARDKPVKLIRRLFIKRYGTRNVPFLKSIQRQFGYWEELLPYERKSNNN